MKLAIHQPHYFPWIGYFDKMAKADAFVLLDEVQLEKGSQMIRNRVLDETGTIRYITISGETKGFLNRKYNELLTKNTEEWTARQMNALKSYYCKAKYWNEISPYLTAFFNEKHETICQYTCSSIHLICNLLEIKTPLEYQSAQNYNRTSKRSDLVLDICKTMDADIYFSGRGASVQYLDQEKFSANGIQIVFQDFQHPIYLQAHSNKFVPGVSSLDMLFNCGIIESRYIFWKNVQNSHEFR